MLALTRPDGLVLIRDTDDGIQWIRRRVEVWIERCEVPLHCCFSDGIVAHCVRAHDGGPRLFVMATLPCATRSASSYGSPFTLYVREIGSVEIIASDAIPNERPWRRA